VNTCTASTVVPIYARTVICELEHRHDGPHHGHIDEGHTTGSHHLQGPRSWDWIDGREARED